jgi:hypothetical protein
MSRIAEQGLLMARQRDWRLFLVRSRKKQALVTDWRHQATNEKECLGFLLKRFPDRNWGMVVGRESGTFVLDGDGDDGLKALADLERQGRVLSETLMARRGRGAHEFRLVACPGEEVLK